MATSSSKNVGKSSEELMATCSAALSMWKSLQKRSWPLVTVRLIARHQKTTWLLVACSWLPHLQVDRNKILKYEVDSLCLEQRYALLIENDIKGIKKKKPATFFKRILLRFYSCYNNGLHLILTTKKFAIQNGINQPCRINTFDLWIIMWQSSKNVPAWFYP